MIANVLISLLASPNTFKMYSLNYQSELFSLKTLQYTCNSTCSRMFKIPLLLFREKLTVCKVSKKL